MGKYVIGNIGDNNLDNTKKTKSFVIGDIGPSWEERKKQQESINQKIVSSYEPPKNYEVIPNLLPQSPPPKSVNNFTPNISFDDVSEDANVNVPGFNINLGNKVSNPMTMLKPNLGQNYEKEIVSKAGEFIGNIPLADPVTYATNKLLGTDNYFRVKDLARLSDASMALGEKTPSFIDYARENAKPSNTIRGLDLPSNNNTLDYATFTKQQANNKLNNSLEALKGKYSPNPLRLGATDKQVSRFEAKDTMPALTQVGKLGISGVMDPLNFVGADLISGLSKGKKLTNVSRYADDITEMGVKEVIDKDKYLAEQAPTIRKNLESFLQENKLRQTPQGQKVLNFGKQLALPAADKATPLLEASNKIYSMPAVNPKAEFETFKKTMVSKYTNAYDNIVEQIQNKVGNYELNAAEQAKYSDLIQQATDNIQKAEYYAKLTPEKLRGKLNAGVIEPEELNYFDRIRQYSEAKTNLQPAKTLQKEVKPIEPNYNLTKGMTEQPKKVLLGEMQKAQLGYMKSKNPSNINTLELNKNVPESQIKPNYDTVGDGKLLGNQTGGVKNILGNVRDDAKLPTVESATQSLIQDAKANKKSLWNKLEDAYTQTINKDYTLGKKDVKTAFGEGLQMKAANTSNNRGIVDYVLREKLVDKNGTPIGNSYKSIIDNIPASSQNAFEDYILHKHNMARMQQEKPIFVKDANGIDVTPEYSAQKIAEYEQNIPQFKQWSQDLNKWINDFMQAWGVDTGLISQDKYNMLKEMYPDYVPTYRILDEVEQGGKSFGKSGKYVDMPNVIKRAKGSSKPVQSPLQNIMELANKTIRTAKNNEVGQYIIDAIKANPEGTKAFASIVEEPKTGLDNLTMVEGEEGLEGVIDSLDKQFANTDKTKPNVVRVMVNGEPTYIKIADKNFLDAVTGLTTATTKTEQAGRALTGWFKGLITQYNPLFTVKNIIRDLPVAYVNGSEANPVKFMLDLKNASKEMGTNGKIWQEYKGLGGTSGGFFSVDKSLDRSLYGNALDRGLSIIEKANVSTEQLPRFAEYMKIVKKYNNTPEARMKGLFAANDLTVNFARKGAGDLVRSADAFVPYLNSGLQGLDKLKRQLIKNPFATLGKAGFAVGSPTVGLYLLNSDNPYYQQLDNRTKDTYFNIPNYLDVDESGTPKTFIKIPKTREYGAIFGALFERGLRQAFGEKDSYKGIGDTLATNFAPSNPLTDNVAQPILRLMLGSNEDFAGRTIVPQSLQNRSPELQYDEQTTELAKKIGKLGISPKQIDYLINSYSGVVGQIAMPIMQNKSTAVSAPTDILKKNFVSDPLYNNQLSKDFYESKKQLETKRSDYKALNPDNKKKYKDLTLTKVTKDADKAGDLYDKIRTLDPVKDKEQIKKLRSEINTIFSKANKQMNP